MKSPDQVLAELREAHGERLAVARTGAGLVVCRPPSAAEHQRLCDKLGDNRKSDYSAQKELVYSCRVHPEREAFAAVLESYPALVNKLADALVTLAGADVEVSTGE